MEPATERVTQVARAKMGVLSRGSTGELRMLARLLDDGEPITAMVMAKVRGSRWFSGRIVAATPRRLLVVGKAPLTRRERIDEIPLDRIRSARVQPPTSLELTLDRGVLGFSFVAPPPQLSALAHAARRGSGPPRFEALDELARRKLGRLLGFGVEGSLVAVAEELAPDEEAIDLAHWTGKPGGLVVVSTTRVVAVPNQGLGTGTPISVPFAELVDVQAGGTSLTLRTERSEHRFERLAPEDQASTMATRIRARCDLR